MLKKIMKSKVILIVITFMILISGCSDNLTTTNGNNMKKIAEKDGIIILESKINYEQDGQTVNRTIELSIKNVNNSKKKVEVAMYLEDNNGNKRTGINYNNPLPDIIKSGFFDIESNQTKTVKISYGYVGGDINYEKQFVNIEIIYDDFQVLDYNELQKYKNNKGY